MPHYYSNYIDDIRKLKLFSSQPSDYRIPFKINPITGKYTKDRYSIANTVLLVFAVIAKHNAAALNPAKCFEQETQEKYDLKNALILQGVINKKSEPEFNSDPPD